MRSSPSAGRCSEGRAAAAAGLASAGQPAAPVNARVRARLDALGAGTPRRGYAERRAAQAGEPAGPADDHDRVVPADRGDPPGTRRPPGRAHR